ncbi:SMI1/KNR4 family protein [Pseudomonas sp. CF161]|uniref:SMI1/KNR4 family protein n=1 Tax=Pseudomonas sp. CF161 TaxID=911241 RepID=UPI0012EC0C84|nr:SMI1/KNR4 family protein [Pseudomonas sp. CF161]
MQINSGWVGNEGASAAALERLRSVAPSVLPLEYYQLLACSNGGEGPLPDPFFTLCLDPAETASDSEQIAMFADSAPGLFVLGSDGGGQLFAFDTRGQVPLPIVSFDGVDPDASLCRVASSFAELLTLIGRE